MSFATRYGPWALVVGGSVGLGRALAEGAARRGLNLVLTARRSGPLQETAEHLRHRWGVRVQTISLDLAEPGAAKELADRLEALDIGLLITNAALAPIGRFLDESVETHEQILSLNGLTAAVLARCLAPKMVDRGRGGLLFVSSLASLQGTALVSHYAATKAYLRVLAEGLWAELRPLGVDVLASCPGPVDTPTFRATGPRIERWRGLAPASADEVAEASLKALGRGPVVTPGWDVHLAAQLMTRVLPKRAAVWLSSLGTRRLYPDA